MHPSSATVQPNDTIVFRAVLVVADELESTPTLDWTASGGTITNDGTFVAGTKAGPVDVTVKARGRGRGREARAKVVVKDSPDNPRDSDPPDLPPDQDPGPNGPTGDWTLKFHDEFDGTELDGTKWHTAWPWSNSVINGELQMFQNCPYPVNAWQDACAPGDYYVVRDGTLRLIARDVTFTDGAGTTFDYVSGAVNTRDIYSFTYGAVEVRAKLPAGKGLWPQLWLNPQTNGMWPPEIDLMEAIGSEVNKVHHNVQWRDADGAHQAEPGVIYATDWFADWHTYTLEWTASDVIFFIDGAETYRLTGHSPTIAMNLMLNLGVGGGWPGDPDTTTSFPATFEIDYVRVWQE